MVLNFSSVETLKLGSISKSESHDKLLARGSDGDGDDNRLLSCQNFSPNFPEWVSVGQGSLQAPFSALLPYF